MIRKYLHIVLLSTLTLVVVALGSSMETAEVNTASVSIWHIAILMLGVGGSLTAGKSALKRMQANILQR